MSFKTKRQELEEMDDKEIIDSFNTLQKIKNCTESVIFSDFVDLEKRALISYEISLNKISLENMKYHVNKAWQDGRFHNSELDLFNQSYYELFSLDFDVRTPEFSTDHSILETLEYLINKIEYKLVRVIKEKQRKAREQRRKDDVEESNLRRVRCQF